MSRNVNVTTVMLFVMLKIYINVIYFLFLCLFFLKNNEYYEILYAETHHTYYWAKVDVNVIWLIKQQRTDYSKKVSFFTWAIYAIYFKIQEVIDTGGKINLKFIEYLISYEWQFSINLESRIFKYLKSLSP